MAQQTFQSCNVVKKEFGRTLRPLMIPPDLGTYTVDERPRCISNGEMAPRRRDVGPPRWGKGVPTQDTRRDTLCDTLATSESRPLQTIATEQGPVQLPYGPEPLAYMPSVALLQAVPALDSRRSGISDRYYR